MEGKSSILSNNKIEDSNKENNRKFRKFLLKQIVGPKDKWSDEFQEYVEKKKKEARGLELDDSPELSLKESQIKTYNEYLRNLSIEDAEEYFKDKDVIDLGCGEGEFVLECIERGGVESIYGLDLEIKKELSSGSFKDYFVEGDFTKPFPFAKADCVISNGGVSTLTLEEKGGEKFEELLRNSLEILTKKGEMRIAPMHKYYHSNMELVGIDTSMEGFSEALDKLEKEGLIDYEFMPIDIQVSGKDYGDVWLWETLIIRPKKN